MEGAISTVTFIASMTSLSERVLELKGGSWIGRRDGVEEAVDDDDGASREDRVFWRDCLPRPSVRGYTGTE